MVVRWNGPQNNYAAVPATPVTTHLDRLAEEITRKGWKAVPRYEGPQPLLHVVEPSVPEFGESVTLVPGTTCGLWWFRSSTGEDLAPHTKPDLAAARVIRILIPYVTTVLAARSHKQAPVPAAGPDPSHGAAIAELQARFDGVVCWWGAYTHEWWAVVPGGTQWQIVNAQDPAALARAIINARNRR